MGTPSTQASAIARHIAHTDTKRGYPRVRVTLPDVLVLAFSPKSRRHSIVSKGETTAVGRGSNRSANAGTQTSD